MSLTFEDCRHHIHMSKDNPVSTELACGPYDDFPRRNCRYNARYFEIPAIHWSKVFRPPSYSMSSMASYWGAKL